MKNKFDILGLTFEEADMVVFGLGLVRQVIGQSKASAKEAAKGMNTLAGLEEKVSPILQEMEARAKAKEAGEKAIAAAVKKK